MYIRRFFAFPAVCALLLVSCKGGEDPKPVDPTSFDITLQGSSSTSSYFVNDENFAVYPDQVKSGRMVEFTNKSSLNTLKFEGSVECDKGSHVLYGIGPVGSIEEGSETGGKVKVEFDGLTQILLMDPYSANLQSEKENLQNVRFKYIGGILQIIPDDISSKQLLFDTEVTSLKVETSSYPVTGFAMIDLQNGNMDSWEDVQKSFQTSFSKENTCTINGHDAIFLVAKPGTIPAGEKITVSITVNGHRASRTITLESALTLNEKTPTALKVDYSDEHIDQGGGEDPDNVYAKWAEMPVINDKDGDGIDDINSDLYYACHSFSMGGRTMRNYTVCYDSRHICPLWISAPRHECYSGSTGRTNAYRPDPEIPASYQYCSKDTGGGCNKGHMLGSEERKCCAEANRQVFYYSNIAPQSQAGFNTGAGGWNILEDWVDKQVCSDTLYIVIGTYFDTFTDGYNKTVQPRTIEFGGRSGVARPTMFYYVLLRTKNGNTRKNVMDCSAGELKCAAFVRSHTDSHKDQKVTSKDMMSLSNLEKITGVSYFANVPNAPKGECNPSDWGL